MIKNKYMKEVKIIRLRNEQLRIEYWNDNLLEREEFYENSFASNSAIKLMYFTSEPTEQNRKAIVIYKRRTKESNELDIVKSFKLKNHNIEIIDSPEYLTEKEEKRIAMLKEERMEYKQMYESLSNEIKQLKKMSIFGFIEWRKKH